MIPIDHRVMPAIRIVYLIAFFGYCALPFIFNQIIPIDTSFKALLTMSNLFPLFGMAFIIVCIEFSNLGRENEDNKVVDPSSDVLDDHPETKQALKDTERLHFLFRQLPGPVVRSIVGEDGMNSTGDLEEIRTRLDEARERSRQKQINRYGKVLSEP